MSLQPSDTSVSMITLHKTLAPWLKGNTQMRNHAHGQQH